MKIALLFEGYVWGTGRANLDFEACRGARDDGGEVAQHLGEVEQAEGVRVPMKKCPPSYVSLANILLE